MTWLFSILTLLVTSVQANPPFVEPRFKSYYQDFSELAQKHHCTVYNKLLLVTFDGEDTFAKVGPNVVGVCYWSGEWRYVAIKKSYWDAASSFQRTVLIYHELGHCLLNREHNSTLLEGKCPSSFMHPSIVDVGCEGFNQVYINELFRTEVCQDSAAACSMKEPQ